MKFKISTPLKTLFILTVILLNIGCDQVSKHIVRRDIGYDQNISFLNDHFTLMKVENTGAFLSLGDQIPATIKFILLTVIPIILLAAAFIYVATNKYIATLPLIAACCVIGGGIGNVYDRLIYGSVTDFMHIGFGAIQTGIFNMADLSVTIGMVILFVWYYLKSRRDKQMGLLDV